MSALVIKQVETAEEYAEAIRLPAEAFARGDLASYRRFIGYGEGDRQRPNFDYGDRWIALVDGEIVSYAIFRLYPIRYGTARIEMVGLGAVSTPLRFQGKGYNAALLHAALQAFREKGVAVAMLNGIPDYYHRFGFVPIIPDYTVEIPTTQAAALDQPLTVRPATRADLPAMAALYETHWPRMTLARGPIVWNWYVGEDGSPFTWVAVDSSGTVRGYRYARDTTSTVSEVVADDLAAAQSLLAEAGRAFSTAGEKTIRWTMPPDDAFIGHARQMVNIMTRVEYLRNAGWMGCVLNPDALVQQVEPVLREAGFTVCWQGEQIELAHNGEREYYAPNAFLQLLTGLHSTPRLPFTPAMIAPWDWF